MNWDDYRCFLDLARAGSLSGAARLLHVDHTTVGRRIAALEAALGVRLIERLGREIRLTDQGRALAALGSPVEDAMARVERAAAGSISAMAGEVHISAPPSLAAMVLAPNLARLHQSHPAIEITLSSEKSFADLNRREADIALRLSRPLANGLVIRKLSTIPFRFFASRAYDRPEEDWEFIAYHQADDPLPQQTWLMQHIGNRRVVLRCSDAASQTAAAASGLGVALLPDYLGDGDPRLRACDSTLHPPQRDLWLVVHEDIRHAPRVRVVMDYLIDLFAKKADFT